MLGATRKRARASLEPAPEPSPSPVPEPLPSPASASITRGRKRSLASASPPDIAEPSTTNQLSSSALRGRKSAPSPATAAGEAPTPNPNVTAGEALTAHEGSAGAGAGAGDVTILHFTNLTSTAETQRIQTAAAASALFTISPSVVPGCVLVTSSVLRTIKICEAFCVAKAVVTPLWVRESLRAGALSRERGYEAPTGDVLKDLTVRLCSTVEAFARRDRAVAKPLEGWTVAVAKPSRGDVKAGTRAADFKRIAALLGASMGERAPVGGLPGRFVAICAEESEKVDVTRLEKAGACLVTIYFLTDTCLSQTTQQTKYHRFK